MKQPGWEHLVGAYGKHWRRDQVSWGSTSSENWFMFGRLNSRRPALRFCDFRRASGVYVLEKRGHPKYVGLARSEQGFGARLAAHHRDASKDWTAFSWFAFEEICDEPLDRRRKDHPKSWAYPVRRAALEKPTVKDLIGELEAMFVTVIGHDRLVNTQNPRFPGAQEWTQVVRSNFGPGGLCSRADPRPFTNQDLLR